MSKGPGQPKKHRVLKGFYMEPELIFRMVRKLTPEGQQKPPHGAESELINRLVSDWLSKGQDGTPHP